MKRKIILGISVLLLLNNCSTTYHTGTSAASKSPQPRSTTPSISQTEQEYNTLIKTYKPETADGCINRFTE